MHSSQPGRSAPTGASTQPANTDLPGHRGVPTLVGSVPRRLRQRQTGRSTTRLAIHRRIIVASDTCNHLPCAASARSRSFLAGPESNSGSSSKMKKMYRLLFCTPKAQESSFHQPERPFQIRSRRQNRHVMTMCWHLVRQSHWRVMTARRRDEQVCGRQIMTAMCA